MDAPSSSEPHADNRTPIEKTVDAWLPSLKRLMLPLVRGQLDSLINGNVFEKLTGTPREIIVNFDEMPDEQVWIWWDAYIKVMRDESL